MTPELPRWKCHKEVNADKIVRVEATTTGAKLHLESGAIAEVNLLWQDRHRPAAGGYYVVYKDNYTSYSPAEAFEEGYTRIVAGQLTPEQALEQVWSLVSPDCGPNDWAGIVKGVEDVMAEKAEDK